MKIILDGLDDLKQLIAFVNADKDELLKEETKDLNESAASLKKAVETAGKEEKK